MQKAFFFYPQDQFMGTPVEDIQWAYNFCFSVFGPPIICSPKESFWGNAVVSKKGALIS